MPAVTQILGRRFPDGQMDIQLLGIEYHLDEIVTRLSLTLQEWEEDGFSGPGIPPFRGAFLQLESGHVFLIRQSPSPYCVGEEFSIWAQIKDFRDVGLKSLTHEILGALGLIDAHVAYRPAEAEVQQEVAISTRFSPNPYKPPAP